MKTVVHNRYERRRLDSEYTTRLLIYPILVRTIYPNVAALMTNKQHSDSTRQSDNEFLRKEEIFVDVSNGFSQK